jgi:ATP-dependent phosphoenolpyruvate carboxykinase
VAAGSAGKAERWGGGIDELRKAASQAQKSIYLATDKSGYLYQVSKYSRKGVKLHILITLTAAKESSQLKSLLARGAVIWVDTRFPSLDELMVIDEECVVDLKKKQTLKNDRSAAYEYINAWKNQVAPDRVVPCR